MDTARTPLRSKVRSLDKDCPFCEDGGNVNQDMEGYICASCNTIVPTASILTDIGTERYEKSNLVKLYGGFDDAYLHEADVDEEDVGAYEFIETDVEDLVSP